MSLPITDPTWIFFLVLGIILITPLLLERLRLPSIVGLIVAGIVVGPHGIGLLDRDASFEIFGKVGLYYIMFLASLEMQLGDVRKNLGRALGFGLISFALPFGLGILANRSLLGLSFPAAVMVASMYAAHTLLTYPLIMRWGLSKHRAVGITVGGTIVTNVITLLVLAVVGGTYKTDGGDFNLLILVGKVLFVGVGILLLFPRVTRWVFRRVDSGVLQYVFVLSLVFLGAALMQWVGMEGILGAFLVGLALNRSIPPAGPLRNHIEFLGNAIFIPYFLIGVGMIINIQSVFSGWEVALVASVMLLVGTGAKWLAAWVSQRLFGLSSSERGLIVGLSTARAAATLAIALVGYEILLPDGSHLLGDTIMNASMVLILGSCIVASMFTERAAQRIVLSGEATQERAAMAKDTMLLALSNPRTVIPMVNMALMLRTPSPTAQVTAVSVILDDDPERRNEAQKNLDYAAKMAAAINVRMLTHCRWSVNPVTGIVHSAKEYEASDILIGLHQKAHISETFYGKFAVDLMASAHQQIIVYRALIPLYSVRRLHIAVPHKAEYDPGFAHWTHRMATLAEQLSCRISLYSSPKTLEAIAQNWAAQRHHPETEQVDTTLWNDFLPLASRVRTDHMVIFITARRGMPSHHRYLDTLPQQVERYFSARSSMIVLPARESALSSPLLAAQRED